MQLTTHEPKPDTTPALWKYDKGWQETSVPLTVSPSSAMHSMFR